MRRAALAAALFAVVASVGCGGRKSGSVPAGASIAPRSAPVFVSLKTDFGSDQWKTSLALFRKFPGGSRLLRQATREFAKERLDFDRDVRPALGPELDVVFVDFENGGNDVVALTKPKNPRRLDALLAKGDRPAVHERVEGWTVIADAKAKLDRFERARAAGTLDDVAGFRDVMKRLDADAAVKAYVNGEAVQREIDRAVAASGVPGDLAHEFETLHALGASATAESEGVRFVGDLGVRLTAPLESYRPKLPKALPGGALLYVSFSHLDRQLRRVLRAVARTNPTFEPELRQVEGVLGMTLEGDVLPLASGEGAFAIYPGRPIPTLELVVAVKDEAGAKRLIERIGAIAELGGAPPIHKVTVAGVDAHEVRVPDANVTIDYAVFDGKLVIGNGRAPIEGLRGDGSRLADDPLYKEARAGAHLSQETSLLAYANLGEGLPAAFDFAEQQGSVVPQEARANTRALRAAILSVTRAGEGYRAGAFVTIK